MKKLIVLFAVYVLLVPSNCFAQDSSKNLFNQDSLKSHHIVLASDADQLMGAYQLWEALLPDSILWNPKDSTIHYFKKTLSSAVNYENQSIIKLNEIAPVYEDSVRAARGGNTLDSQLISLPYSFGKNLVQSYYFSKYDLSVIDTLMKQQFPNVEHNGYRAYMALQPYSCNNEADVRSHIYLGPSNKTKGEFRTKFTNYPMVDPSNDENIFLDLTLPCPKGCTQEFGTQIPNVGNPCEAKFEPTLKEN